MKRIIEVIKSIVGLYMYGVVPASCLFVYAGYLWANLGEEMSFGLTLEFWTGVTMCAFIVACMGITLWDVDVNDNTEWV